jgi:hypothetical protein
MCFKDPPKVIKQPTLSRDLIKDPDIELHVSLAVADTYLIHTNALDPQEILRLTAGVGSAKRDLRLAGPDKKYFHDSYRSEEEENRRAAMLGNIHEFLDSFPIAQVQNGDFKENLSDDIFLETLINNIRNECLSYQIFLSKTVTESTKNIISKLKTLKLDYSANEIEIDEMEKKLDSIIDNSLRNRLEATSNFEILQNEKITPFFLNLAKGNKSEASLTDLLDDDGNPFRSDAELKEHIRNFYQKIYRKPESDNRIRDDSIKTFLGEEICNSRLVKDCIIPDHKAEQFEEFLSIEELDESASQGNRSAAGMDGINNCFIKKFWHLLRIPLHRYTTCCHRKGSLTQSFRTASIKLIPKKGDCTKIKNWRPISLLSCLYKVVSRALNNRLKEVSGIIFSRGQKGFTKDRHIQEVLMNIVEMISHCKEYGIPGAILSIDTAKAFDTVSHRYMHLVYSFFGFGPNFIKLMETLGNNRTACIAFDDGSHSAEIVLECGRAQGNTSSPVEYNMAQQIVLFKIELCPEVRNVYQNHFIARPYLPAPIPETPILPLPADSDDQRFRNEAAFETSKADGFADDNTTGTIFEYDSLKKLKDILTDFADISGLRCNTEKTALMQIGNKIPVSQEIKDLGFDITDKVHILGMDIDSEVEALDNNFVGTVTSLKKCIDYWKRYNLSMIGRINVIKSLLFSQILYLGSFLMPSSEKLRQMQKLLDDFAVSDTKIARDRITLPVELGGLGLFDVEKFLISQQASWVFKAHKSSRDNWRYKLRSLCNGNVLCAGPGLIKESANPILHGISSSFQKVRLSHDSLNSNFTEALVLNNPIFFRGPGDKLPLTLTYLGLPENGESVMSSLSARSFFNVNGIKTRMELAFDYNLQIGIEGYVNLVNCLNHYVRRLKPNERNNGSRTSLSDEFCCLKKPGKKIRASLVKKRRKKFELRTQGTTVTFLQITGTEFPGEKQYGNIVSLWNSQGLPNRIRVFLFKFFNNILGINTRLSHFVPNQSRGCTFCLLTGTNPLPDETFIHVFFDCATVKNWHNKFFNEFFPNNYLVDVQDRKTILLLGRVHEPDSDNFFIGITILIFQYVIWEQKLKKKIPSYQSIKNQFIEHIKKLWWGNTRARKESSKSNFLLCRTLGNGERRQGHQPDGAAAPLPPGGDE